MGTKTPFARARSRFVRATRLPTLLGLLAVATIESGCASVPRPPENKLISTKPEVRVARRTFSAELLGNSVHATIALAVECRTVKTYTDDERASEWLPCEVDPPPSELAALRGIAIILRAGSVELTEATDALGTARFDLDRLTESTSQPGEAHVSIKLATTKTIEKVVSLEGAPAIGAWNTAEKARQAERKADEAKERATRGRTEALSALAQIESAIDGFNEKKWTDDQLVLFARLSPKMNQIMDSIEASGAEFTEAEVRRFRAIAPRLERLLPSWEKARAAARAREKKAQEQATRDVLLIGRQIVLARLRSPSTAQFAGDTVVLRCPSGFVVTAHDVDAQNAFGAMIRDTMCPKFNPTTRRVIASTEPGGGATIDTSCNRTWLDCDFLDSYRMTAGL